MARCDQRWINLTFLATFLKTVAILKFNLVNVKIMTLLWQKKLLQKAQY